MRNGKITIGERVPVHHEMRVPEVKRKDVTHSVHGDVFQQQLRDENRARDPGFSMRPFERVRSWFGFRGGGGEARRSGGGGRGGAADGRVGSDAVLILERVVGLLERIDARLDALGRTGALPGGAGGGAVAVVAVAASGASGGPGLHHRDGAVPRAGVDAGSSGTGVAEPAVSARGLTREEWLAAAQRRLNDPSGSGPRVDNAADKAQAFVQGLGPAQLSAAGAAAEALEHGGHVDEKLKAIVQSLASLLRLTHGSMDEVMRIIREGHANAAGQQREIVELWNGLRQLRQEIARTSQVARGYGVPTPP